MLCTLFAGCHKYAPYFVYRAPKITYECIWIWALKSMLICWCLDLCAIGLLLIDETFGILQRCIFNLSCGCIFNLSWGWLFNIVTWCYSFICVIDSHTTGRGVKGNCTVRLDILTRDNNPAQPADPLFREIPYVSLLVHVWNCAVVCILTMLPAAKHTVYPWVERGRNDSIQISCCMLCQ